MASMRQRSNRIAVLSTVLALVTLAACGDNGTDPEPEPDVATVRVSVGTFSVDIPTPCQGTNTPVPLTVNQANQVSFRFLGPNGQDEPIIVDERANIELRFENRAAGWSYTATGGSGATFTANITPSTTGSFLPRVDLLNNEHGHNEVECLVRVTAT